MSRPRASTVSPSTLAAPGAHWIKACGARSRRDLEACAASGATHVGINTWPNSPRYVPPGVARGLVSAARSLGLAPVLLVLPGSTIRECELLDWAPAFLQALVPPTAALRAKLAKAGIGVVEARRMCGEDASRLPWGDRLLLDSSPVGGTGRVFPWELARSAPRPFILAGGLGPDNVGAAIAATGAHGVDAASGLESKPGAMDYGRLRDFCAAARAAFSERVAHV